MNKVSPIIFPALMLLLLATPASARTDTEHQYADSCLPAQLAVTLDSKNGEFDGMSQSGALLEFRNTGKTACTLTPLPTLTFEDAKQHPLAIERRVPRGMHPGPALLPVSIAPETKVAAQLHWVASDAFDAGNCVTPAFVSLEMKSGTLRVSFDHMMCAAAGKNTYFDQGPLGLMK